MADKIPSHFTDPDDRILLAHIADLFEERDKKRKNVFSSFLDLHMQSVIKEFADDKKYKNYSFSGGYKENERVLLCIEYADEPYKLPIDIIKLNSSNPVSHRDILGALMGTGIKRDVIGDIVKADDCFYIFVLNSITDYIMQNFEKAGKAKVDLLKVDSFNEDDIKTEFQQITGTVASLRFDSIISSACKISRAQAVKLIKAGQCFVNSRCVSDPAFNLNQADKFTVRGSGKFILSEVGALSKKGRTFIKINKFI